VSPILNLVKSKGQRKSKLEVKRKEWKSHIDIGNWYWQHWIQATFPAAPALHPPKHCAGEEQKVRSKTSSTAHLFVLGFIVALAACGAALLFRSLTLQRVLVNSSTPPHTLQPPQQLGYPTNYTITQVFFLPRTFPLFPHTI